MPTVAAVAGMALIGMILWEAFAVFVLTRRVSRRFNLTLGFLRFVWSCWKAVGRAVVSSKLQQTWLSFFGPSFILLLLGVWAGGLIIGFALLIWGVGSVHVADGEAGFTTVLYYSGSTFFTLGLGDIIPQSSWARLLAVVEAGMGFAFLALVLSYMPPLNQSFVRRETTITLLDARAGSPPTAAEMLRRHGHEHGMEGLRRLLAEWEVWAAELLEGHLAFPALSFFRSQHDNQSWLGGMTAVLDTCALVMAGVEGACARQAELTFAIARHALVDISLMFQIPPHKAGQERLPPEALEELRSRLAAAGVHLHQGVTPDQRLAELRGMYEPFVHGLGAFFQMSIPPWFIAMEKKDNWQVSAWESGDAGSRSPRGKKSEEEHFKSD